MRHIDEHSNSQSAGNSQTVPGFDQSSQFSRRNRSPGSTCLGDDFQCHRAEHIDHRLVGSLRETLPLVQLAHGHHWRRRRPALWIIDLHNLSTPPRMDLDPDAPLPRQHCREIRPSTRAAHREIQKFAHERGLTRSSNCHH